MKTAYIICTYLCMWQCPLTQAKEKISPHYQLVEISLSIQIWQKMNQKLFIKYSRLRWIWMLMTQPLCRSLSHPCCHLNLILLHILPINGWSLKLTAGSSSLTLFIPIFYCNTHGICYKLAEFHDALYNSPYNPFSIICITETWLDNLYADNLIIGSHPYLQCFSLQPINSFWRKLCTCCA